MAIPADQIYRLGAEALGWNSSTAEGKAVIAEDMALLKKLQAFRCATRMPFCATRAGLCATLLGSANQLI